MLVSLFVNLIQLGSSGRGISTEKNNVSIRDMAYRQVSGAFSYLMIGRREPNPVVLPLGR